MKKKIFAAMAAGLLGMTFLSSCSVSVPTVSVTKLASVIGDVDDELGTMGYKITGKSSDLRNEVYVAATSYTSKAGYSTALGNDYYLYDTYTYTDGENNTASYKMKYQFGEDDNGKSYVVNVSVVGCETSNPKDYGKICGYDGAVKKLNRIDSDQVSVLYDEDATLLLMAGVLIATLGVLTIVILL
jgi:hypothetical protein